MMYNKRKYLTTTISLSVLFHWLKNLVQFLDDFTIAGAKNVLIHMMLHLNFAQFFLVFYKENSSTAFNSYKHVYKFERFT